MDMLSEDITREPNICAACLVINKTLNKRLDGEFGSR